MDLCSSGFKFDFCLGDPKQHSVMHCYAFETVDHSLSGLTFDAWLGNSKLYWFVQEEIVGLGSSDL